MDEVILFRCPGDSSHLVILNLPLSVTESDLYILFSSYGLIYEISIKSKVIDNYNNIFQPDKYDICYAFIKYYSQYDAAVAKKYVNGTKFNGNKLKVSFIQRTNKFETAAMVTKSTNIKSNTDNNNNNNNNNNINNKNEENSCVNNNSNSVTSNSNNNSPNKSTNSNNNNLTNSPSKTNVRPSSIPLSYTQCVEVANYFLGYNAWSCSVDELRAYNHSTDSEIQVGRDLDPTALTFAKQTNYKYSWTARVQLIIRPQSHFQCTAVCHSPPDSISQNSNNGNHGKKKAVTYAYRYIFNNLAIIRLKEGTTHVKPLI